MTTSLRARAGLTGIFALAGAGVTGIAVAAPANAATPDGSTAAHFLTSQMAATGGYFVSSGMPDYGLTIDGILGLDAAQTGQTGAQAAASYVTKSAATYNTGGDPAELYAGSTAKLVVLAQAQGLSPDGYLAQLKSLEQPSGQFKDKSQYGDYSNAIGQSLAIVGLTRAGKPDATAVDFLVKQQCADGGFRMTFTGTCTGDTDATSLAVQALSAAGGHDAEVTKAVNFIVGKQQSNGGVVEPAAQATPNANSTGLAAVAFTIAGKTAQATKAKSFVQGLQFGCAIPSALRGAIAYDQKAFDTVTAEGSKATVSDKENRSTAQALLAFNPQPYLKISAGGSATAPALSCATSDPTSTATTTAGSTAAASAASTTTGPAIITDGTETGSGNTSALFAGAAVLGGVALAGGGLRRRLRSRD